MNFNINFIPIYQRICDRYCPIRNPLDTRNGKIRPCWRTRHLHRCPALRDTRSDLRPLVLVPLHWGKFSQIPLKKSERKCNLFILKNKLLLVNNLFTCAFGGTPIATVAPTCSHGTAALGPCHCRRSRIGALVASERIEAKFLTNVDTLFTVGT